MEFIVQRNDLLSALTITGKGITKSVLPILSSYRFSITGDTCMITGSNMEVFITKSIDIKSKIDSLDICVGSKELLPLIKALPDQPLTFKIVGLKVSVKSATGKYDLPAEEGKDYPATPVIEGDIVNVSSDLLIDGIEKTLFSIDPNIGKEGFRYALLDFGKGINLVGCNTRVMSIARIFEDDVKGNKSLISKSALEILKSISTKGDVGISYTDKNVFFTLFDGTMMTAQVVDEKYPDYNSIIPVSNKKKMSVDSSELLAAIKRVSLFGYYGVLFNFKGGILEIKAEDVDYSKAAFESVPCDYTGEDFKIMLMGEQLAEMLLKMKGCTAYFSFNERNTPALIRADDVNTGFDLFLSMPLVFKGN